MTVKFALNLAGYLLPPSARVARVHVEGTRASRHPSQTGSAPLPRTSPVGSVWRTTGKHVGPARMPSCRLSPRTTRRPARTCTRGHGPIPGAIPAPQRTPPADRPTDRTTVRPVVQPTDRPPDRPTDDPTDRPTARQTARTPTTPLVRPPDRLPDRPPGHQVGSAAQADDTDPLHPRRPHQRRFLRR